MSAHEPGPDASDFAAIAALAVAVVALCVTGAQVAQQYAASGEKIRLCDSSVYGPMPGRGRRTWNWVQLRFNVTYEMPQISISPDLWRFVHDTSAQNPVAEDDLKNLPNLLLSQTSLEDSAEILLRRPRWMWPFLVIRNWGLESLLMWRIPVRPHPEADYQFSTISLATVIATKGNSDNLQSLQSSLKTDTSTEANSQCFDRFPWQYTMSVNDKVAMMMRTPRWLWPFKIARLWGWRTLFSWRVRLQRSVEADPRFRDNLPRIEFVANVNTEPDFRIKVPLKRRLLRAVRQLSKLQLPALSKPPPEPSLEEELQMMRREYADLYIDQRPSEASWVFFCRSMQSSCGSVLKYQMVKGDADRCPPDLPVVPMLVSLRDIIALCLMSGMGFTRTDIPNRLVSMEGPVGVLLSSTHPILGSILRFIPRQLSFQLGQEQGRSDVRLTTHPVWLRRVVGRHDGSLAMSLSSVHKKLVSPVDPPNLSYASRQSMMQHDSSLVAQNMDNSAQSLDRSGDQGPTDKCAAFVARPWEFAVSDQRAIRSWNDAWPDWIDGTFDPKDSSCRNSERRRIMQERLKNAHADQSPHWSWVSKLDTVRGFWATPWASHFDPGFCTKAQIIIFEALRLVMTPEGLHFIKSPQSRPRYQPLEHSPSRHQPHEKGQPRQQEPEHPLPRDQAPDFLYPAVTTIPYGQKHRTPDSALLRELPELRATKLIQRVDGFNDAIPPIMLVDFLVCAEVNHSNHTSPSLDGNRTQIETDELMWLDSWLTEVAQSSDIQGSWLKDLGFRIHEAIELFHEDIMHQPPIEPNSGTSHRRKVGRAAMQYAQGSAVDLLGYLGLYLDLDHSQVIYFLAAMLRTFKTAYCINTGVDTQAAKDIFEKEISVYFA